jgi:hypothetical protein
VADAFKISRVMFFHFYGDPVLEQVVAFGEKLFRQRADALLCELAIGRAPEIHFRVCQTMAATPALSGGIILKKFYHIPALRAFAFKNGAWLPVSTVLSWAFHLIVSLI